MRRPFFSVVIPTRHRAALLGDAVLSAMFQDFDDVEVIVSDNGDEARLGETARVLDRLPSGRPLTRLRPPDPLSMPDHWEFASSHATGEYVLVLTDRSVLRRDALSRLARAIGHARQPPGACSWRWSLFDDQLGIEYADEPAGVASGLIPSIRLAEAFAACEQAYPYCLPRGLNSCYHRDVARRLRARHGRLFQAISPDFFSAFLLLSELPEILYVDESLFVSQGLSDSNGGNAYQTTTTHYLASLGLGEWAYRGPLKSALVEAFIMEDFLAVQALSGGNLANVRPDWPAFLGLCQRELTEKWGGGRVPIGELDAMVTAWNAAVATLTPADQARTRRIVRSMWKLRLKARVKRAPFGPAIVEIMRRHARRDSRSGDRPRRTVIACAGFDDAASDVPPASRESPAGA
jgi:hypothetical protein